MKNITAIAISLLLSILVLGVVVTVFVPNASDALNHARSVAEPSSDFTWSCPTTYFWETRNVSFEMEIPYEDVLESSEKVILRKSTNMVVVPYDLVDPNDKYVKAIADHILSETSGLPDYSRVNAALYFVQETISYNTDSELYGYDDFYATPVETLYFRQGDCEDTSLLLCSILLAMGYDCYMLHYPGHVAVGIILPGTDVMLECETTRSAHYPTRTLSDSAEIYHVGSSGIMGGITDFLAQYRFLIQNVTGV